jgi:hypothetical protein
MLARRSAPERNIPNRTSGSRLRPSIRMKTGIDVVLTDAGARRHDEAVPWHRDVLARYLPAR